MLTVVTPTLNAAAYLPTCIASVAALPFPHEHIVVDGGSCDGTYEIADDAEGVTVLRQGNSEGMYGAVQEGLRYGRGDVLTYINADDEAIAPAYAKLYNRLRGGSSATIAYGDCTYRWIMPGQPERRQLVRARAWAGYFLRAGEMPFAQPSCLFSRAAFDAVGGFEHRDYKYAGDLEFFRRLALLDHFSAARIRESASVFLKHGNSLGDLNREASADERVKMGAPRIASLPTRVLFKAASYL